MASISRISTLEQLQSVFPGVILIDSRSTARALGIAAKTIHNAGEDFPIRSIRFGRKKFFRILDVACYLDQQLGIEVAPIKSPEPTPVQVANNTVPALKRGRGRPPKATKSNLGNPRKAKSMEDAQRGISIEEQRQINGNTPC